MADSLIAVNTAQSLLVVLLDVTAAAAAMGELEVQHTLTENCLGAVGDAGRRQT